MITRTLFSALVIDDDSSARNILEKYLEADGRVQVYSGLDSAINAFDTIDSLDPDVIFLDINMPYENGLQFAARLRKAESTALLIFCTAFKNYALEAFELKPFDFLVKPFGFDEIVRLVGKIQDELSEKKGMVNKIWDAEHVGKCKLKIATGYIFLKPSEIFYIETSKNWSKLYTVEGEEMKIFSNMSQLHEYLGETRFLRINRAALVNVDYIVNVDRKKKVCILKAADLEKEFSVPRLNSGDLDDLLVVKFD